MLLEIFAVLFGLALLAWGSDRFVDGAVAPEILHRDLPAMFGLILVMSAMSDGFGGPGRMNRWTGVSLVLVFVLYQGTLVFESNLLSIVQG